MRPGLECNRDLLCLAALGSLSLGLYWNRGGAPGEPARHSFWGLPLQVWAAPMLLFAVLLGTGTITTAEEPRASRQAPALVGGSKSP